jgi:hypothetical protein
MSFVLTEQNLHGLDIESQKKETVFQRLAIKNISDVDLCHLAGTTLSVCHPRHLAALESVFVTLDLNC